MDETFGAILISLAIPAQAGVASRIAEESQIFHRDGLFLAARNNHAGAGFSVRRQAVSVRAECSTETGKYAPSLI